MYAEFRFTIPANCTKSELTVKENSQPAATKSAFHTVS